MPRPSSAKRRKISALEASDSPTTRTRPLPSGLPSLDSQLPKQAGVIPPLPIHCLSPHFHSELVEQSGRRTSPSPESSTSGSDSTVVYAGMTLDGGRTRDMSGSESNTNKRDRADVEEYLDEESGLTVREPNASEFDEKTQDQLDKAASPNASSATETSVIGDAHGGNADVQSSSPQKRGFTPPHIIIIQEHPEAFEHASSTDVDMLETAVQSGSSDSTVSITPDEISSRTSTQASEEKSRPSIDEQIGKVTKLALEELKDGQTGYVVSTKWLHRVLSRESDQLKSEKYPRDAREGAIGPVDNSNLNVVPNTDVIPYEDEKGEPFFQLGQNLQLGDDMEVLPQEAWNLLLKWYGLAKGSPVIRRYAHNTSPPDAQSNIQWELHPPLFSIRKLVDPNTSSPKSIRESDAPPVRLIASRQELFNKWLKKAKQYAGIDMKKKVRVWKIVDEFGEHHDSMESTPNGSRNSSPVPTGCLIIKPEEKLVMDLNRFVALKVPTQRELMDAKDETNNPNYNGHSTLDFYGLNPTNGGQDVIVVLEEQIGTGSGGEWVSEARGSNRFSKRTPVSIVKTSTSMLKNHDKPKPNGKGRSNSPAPTGMMTRGRARRDGRPRGVIGFSNLGNTCYMNSALQSVRSVEELTRYFLSDNYKNELNPSNPLSHNGEVAKAYATLLHQMYSDSMISSFSPRHFKQTIGRYGPSFSGYGQQDSQEFLLFLLDGLQEDLNRIQKKPYIEKPDSTDDMVHNSAALRGMADKCWDIYKARNDSVITDLFAGMYKSTLVCPECDKVSIIFDPFNNLTLQLPIENVWSKEICCFPYGKRPFRMAVDIDKHATIKALKEYVATRIGSDSRRMLLGEIYKCKFFRLFDDKETIADVNMQTNDDIAIYEFECAPSNYPAPKKKAKAKAYYGYGSNQFEEEDDIPEGDSPLQDKMLVPIFHRFDAKPDSVHYQWQLFGVPQFIVLDREEAKDYDAILKKVLFAVAPMTTRNIFDGEGLESGDSSTDSKIRTNSIKSEDGIVDVSMRDNEAGKESSPPLEFEDAVINPDLRDIFEIKYFPTTEIVPTGWSTLQDDNKTYASIATRFIQQRMMTGNPELRARFADEEDTSVSGDEDFDDVRPFNTNRNPVDNGCNGSQEEISGVSVSPERSRVKDDFKKNDPPLIQLCDGIILDWRREVYDFLFTDNIGPDRSNSLKGRATWRNMPLFADASLEKRRSLRERRREEGVTLDECLDEFGRPEILSENDAWYCPRCKEHRRASKTFELWKSPDILVIHLKRFSSHRNFRDKLDIQVDFPVEGLDLSKRVAQLEDGKSLIYDLFAVDNHYGGLGGGHYTAYAKNFVDGNWYEYNDSIVSKKNDPSIVVTSAAYLLFYRRRSEKPLGGPFLEKIVTSARRPSDASELNSLAEENGCQDEHSSPSSSHIETITRRSSDRVSDTRSVIIKPSVDDDGADLPEYSDSLQPGEQTMDTMDVDEGIDDMYTRGSSFAAYDQPSWSFPAAGPSGAAPPGSLNGDPEENLFDDQNLSNKAVSSSGLSDPDNRMADFADDEGALGTPIFDDDDHDLSTGSIDASVKEVPPLLEREESPVAEVHVDGRDEYTQDE